LRALELVGVERRADVRSALRACLAQRREQHALFDQAFDLFWSRALQANATPSLEDAAMRAASNDSLAPRIAHALMREALTGQPQAQRNVERALHVASFSADEALRHKDFEQMTAAELAAAERAMVDLALPTPHVHARRWCASAQGKRVDWRATLRLALRTGGDPIALARQARKRQQPPLVAICDISGSMDRYTRVFLHFLHALAQQGQRLHVFLFGTRLTNISRQLAHRDIDIALADIAKQVSDWTGGTRIGACLHEFNQHWSRRVLGQNASVVLMTDGLDRGDIDLLGRNMERLKKSTRALIWLNPLLRYQGFEPKAAGVRAMLPHAQMRPVHDLHSVAQLGAALTTNRVARLIGALRSGSPTWR
jgi:uncharacterized protein